MRPYTTYWLTVLPGIRLTEPKPLSDLRAVVLMMIDAPEADEERSVTQSAVMRWDCFIDERLEGV